MRVNELLETMNVCIFLNLNLILYKSLPLLNHNAWHQIQIYAYDRTFKKRKYMRG